MSRPTRRTRAVLAGQSFDGVACNYGLTDADDLDGLLTTVARVLAVGGWFVTGSC
jgi:ubiquinone/menaquinone biosynthesis C-methylase UbiE